ncbi:hypothetical protein Zmor_020425 [Zophobas morio]|uniref:Gustatory receptor n=1 Tax=Zophobas morio TaxID=2755281 RepID=A0AA38I474_9CUCU|nr:hypothetical protein Zmor_020425 [Zophobas morio]
MNLIEDIPLCLRIIYRLCGIIQFTYEDSPRSFSQILLRLCPIAMFLFYCYTCVVWFGYLVASVNLLKLNVLQVEVMMTVWAVFTEITSMVIFTLRSHKLKMLFLKLEEIRIKPPFREKNKTERDWMKILVLIITFLNFTIEPLHVWGPGFLIMGFFVIPPVTCILNHLFLGDVLKIVRLQFKLINQQLQKKVSVAHIGFPLNKTENLKQLEELSFLHYDLVRLVLEISSYFDVTTLISIVLWFGNFIAAIYILIMMLNAPFQFKFLFSLMCNVFYYLLWLLMIVCMYSRTQKEANKTSTFIHQIWNQHSQKKDLNEGLRHLQLIACRFLNTKLIFNAKNFFRLDETFLHVMIAAVVTYLIILIQFRT